MKKRAALLCAAALALAALTGCSGREPERTAEEWTDLYVQAITNHGGEMVEYNPVISRFDPEDGASALALESLGLAEEDVEAFGASVSVMNTQAYAIAAVRPVQGKTDAVREALQGYVDRQQSRWLRRPGWRPWRTAPSYWSCARIAAKCLRPSEGSWNALNRPAYRAEGRGRLAAPFEIFTVLPEPPASPIIPFAPAGALPPHGCPPRPR